MRVVITGCRHWNAYELAEQVVNRLLARYGPGVIIVHGAATGIDAAFREACEALGVEHEPHPARWDEHGKRAGPIRNQEMVDAGAQMCIAFHRAISASKGTRDCVRRALAAGIACYLIDGDHGVPKRIHADDPRLEQRR